MYEGLNWEFIATVLHDMPESVSIAGVVIHALETNPRQFADLARHTNGLPGMPAARDYSDAEVDQLCSGIVRMLLEAIRNEEPKVRALFMEHAIPSFVREGETPETLVHWNTGFMILCGSSLAASVPAEQRAEVLAWFAAFAGVYVGEVLRAALQASTRQKAGLA